jgi:hypothetical protein
VGRSPGASATSYSSGYILGNAARSGKVAVSDPGAWRELALDNAPADIDMTVSVTTDKPATGRGQNVVLVARRQNRLTEYRVRLRIVSSGQADLSVIRLLGGRRVSLAQTASLRSPVVRPGVPVSLRVVVAGTRPAMIRAKIWASGRAEPASWTVTGSDSSSQLASRGWSGLHFSVAPDSTQLPLTFTYTGLDVATATSTGGTDPTPSPVPTTTPQTSPQTTPAPTGTPTSTPAPTATPTPTTTPTPTATPTPTPTASPTATATPASTPTTVPAGAHVVATDGDDAGPGTTDAPWRTLQHAADVVRAGETVLVREGTYDGFTIRRSGAAGSPVTFAAYPGDKPVVDGRGVLGYTVRLVAVAHVVIDGLTIQGGYMDRQAGGGVSVEGSSYITLTHNTIRDNHSFGVRTENSTHVLVDDNDVYGNAVGIHIGWQGEGTVVSNNFVHENDLMMVNTPDVPGDDAGGEGIAIVHSTGHVTVTGNYVWGNRSASYDYGYDGGAFSVYAASNWDISGNVTWDNRNVFEAGTDADKTPCDGGSFTRNLNYGATTVDRTVGMVLRCASNTLVANNTFVGMQYFVFDISHNRGGWGGSIEGLRVVNNVISVSSGKVYGIETALPSSVVIDYNLVYNAGTGYLATYLGEGTKSLAQLTAWTGEEIHGMQSNPQFADPGGHEYTLANTSPALDNAIFVAGVTDSFAGAAPDRGYAERR